MSLHRNYETFKYAGYMMNYQKRIIAYEMRCRGYSVCALPTDLEDNLSHRPKNGNGYCMGAFKRAQSVDKGDPVSGTKNNISSMMNSRGNGSRAIVYVKRADQNVGGHEFNAENVNCIIWYIDAQTERRVDTNKYLGDSITSATQLVKTDNLRVSERAMKSVTSKRY